MATFTKPGRLGSVSSKIETAANIATLCTAILLSAVLVKTYLLPSPSRNAPPVRLPLAASESVAVGASLSDRLPGVNCNKNGQTLVLALSTSATIARKVLHFFDN